MIDEKTQAFYRSSSSGSVDTLDGLVRKQDSFRHNTQKRPDQATKRWWKYGILVLVLLTTIFATHRHCSGMNPHTSSVTDKLANHPAAAAAVTLAPSAPRQAGRAGTAYKTESSPVQESSPTQVMSMPTIASEYYEILRRAEKSSSTSYSQPAPVAFYNQAGVRFVFVLAAFIILNMFAIVIHHIYQKLSGSERRYRNIDSNISPF